MIKGGVKEEFTASESIKEVDGYQRITDFSSSFLVWSGSQVGHFKGLSVVEQVKEEGKSAFVSWINNFV